MHPHFISYLLLILFWVQKSIPKVNTENVHPAIINGFSTRFVDSERGGRKWLQGKGQHWGERQIFSYKEKNKSLKLESGKMATAEPTARLHSWKIIALIN